MPDGLAAKNRTTGAGPTAGSSEPAPHELAPNPTLSAARMGWAWSPSARKQTTGLIEERLELPAPSRQDRTHRPTARDARHAEQRSSTCSLKGLWRCRGDGKRRLSARFGRSGQGGFGASFRRAQGRTGSRRHLKRGGARRRCDHLWCRCDLSRHAQLDALARRPDLPGYLDTRAVRQPRFSNT